MVVVVVVVNHFNHKKKNVNNEYFTIQVRKKASALSVAIRKKYNHYFVYYY